MFEAESCGRPDSVSLVCEGLCKYIIEKIISNRWLIERVRKRSGSFPWRCYCIFVRVFKTNVLYFFFTPFWDKIAGQSPRSFSTSDVCLNQTLRDVTFGESPFTFLGRDGKRKFTRAIDQESKRKLRHWCKVVSLSQIISVWCIVVLYSKNCMCVPLLWVEGISEGSILLVRFMPQEVISSIYKNSRFFESEMIASAVGGYFQKDIQHRFRND